MRIGAENSTCALFRKCIFVFRCCGNALFHRVCRSTGLASAGEPKQPPGKLRVGEREPNAAILVAKSALSMCSASATQRAAGGCGYSICGDLPRIFSE